MIYIIYIYKCYPTYRVLKKRNTYKPQAFHPDHSLNFVWAIYPNQYIRIFDFGDQYIRIFSIHPNFAKNTQLRGLKAMHRFVEPIEISAAAASFFSCLI